MISNQTVKQELERIKMHGLARNKNPAGSVEKHHQDQIPFHSVIGLNDAVTKLDFLKF